MLLSRGFEAGSHAGVIGLLHREFVRTGRIEHVHAAALERAWKDRTRADYQADTQFTGEDARLAVDRARAFLRAVETAFGA
ncbi:MAG: HEPN domain-containing protein [Candidatus Rokubacteria bacterium]|nr:HEPN domain-containing protein [Candidatus Rokubacteria bacterium]